MKASIGIVDWEKFKPRKDVSSMTWFKCDSNIAFREDLFGLSIETKWIWIFILGLMSKKMRGEFEIDLEYISYHNGGMSVDIIDNALSSLAKNNLLSYIKTEQVQESPKSYDESEKQSSREVTKSNIELLHTDVSQRREEKKRKDEKREDVNFEFSKIRDIDLIQLWNNNFPSKPYKALSLGRGSHASNLAIITNFEDFSTLAQWSSLFDIAKESKFLVDASWFGLTWIIDHDNAIKVLNGQYSGAEKKSDLDTSKIMKVLASGYLRIDEIPEELKLTAAEVNFLRTYGLKSLGHYSNFEVRKMIEDAS